MKIVKTLGIVLFYLISNPVIGQNCYVPQSLAGPDLEICSGTTATLGYPENCDFYYKWLPESVFPSLEEMFLSNPTTVELEENTTVTLYLTNHEGDLIAAVPVEIEIAIDIDLGRRKDVCKGESIKLTPNISNGSGTYEFNWSTGETTESITITPNKPQFYSVEIIDVNTNCTREAEVQVYALSGPDIEIYATHESICESEDPARNKSSLDDCSARISHLYAGTGLNGYSYVWSTGEETEWIEATYSGLYSVTVTKDGGCSSTDSYEVLNCISSVEIDHEYGQNGELYLKAEDGFSKYVWHDGTEGQLIEVTGEGNYSVTVTNEAGCLSNFTK
jgi:hypothetical protein